MTRSEKVAAALKLRNEGKLFREIAEVMGVARSTAAGWIEDPDLSKQRERRKRYSRPCLDCGTATDGSGGYKKPSVRCNACERIRQDAPMAENREYIIRRYVTDRVGCTTISAEIGSDPVTVDKALKRWGVAIREHKRGSWTVLPVDEIVAQYKAGETLESIGERYGVSAASVKFQLDPFGVIRSRSEAQRLRWKRERAA